MLAYHQLYGDFPESWDALVDAGLIFHELAVPGHEMVAQISGDEVTLRVKGAGSEGELPTVAFSLSERLMPRVQEYENRLTLTGARGSNPDLPQRDQWRLGQVQREIQRLLMLYLDQTGTLPPTWEQLTDRFELRAVGYLTLAADADFGATTNSLEVAYLPSKNWLKFTPRVGGERFIQTYLRPAEAADQRGFTALENPKRALEELGNPAWVSLIRLELEPE